MQHNATLYLTTLEDGRVIAEVFDASVARTLAQSHPDCTLKVSNAYVDGVEPDEVADVCIDDIDAFFGLAD